MYKSFFGKSHLELKSNFSEQILGLVNSIYRFTVQTEHVGSRACFAGCRFQMRIHFAGFTVRFHIHSILIKLLKWKKAQTINARR
jgi:hypothetical protein